MEFKKINIGLLLLLIYGLTRLINLNSLPVFADEAIYIRWTQLIIDDPTKAFISMYDGKPPLFIWLIVPMLKTVKDPLIAGRLASVLFGLGILFFIYKTARNFFNYKTGLIAVVLIVFSPFLFLYNRMALMETLLTFILTLQFYFLSCFYKYKNYKYILLSGLSWGLSMLTKTSAFFFFPLYLPLNFYLIKNNNSKKKNSYFNLLKSNKKSLVYLAFSIIIAILVFLITKLSVFFPFLFSRSSDFSFTIKEFIEKEYSLIGYRFIQVNSWIFYYLSPLVFLLFLSTLYNFFKFVDKRHKVIQFLWIFIIIVLLPFILMGKILAPRYFLPLAVPITLLASWQLSLFWQKKKFFYPLLFLILSVNIYFLFTSLIDANKTLYLQVDKTQYLQDWSSGHGIKDAFEYLKNEAKDKKILVATEGYFGTLPDGLVIYKDAYQVANMEVIGIGQPRYDVPSDILERSELVETYILGNSHRLVFSETDPVKLVKRYVRPAGGPDLLLYEVKNKT